MTLPVALIYAAHFLFPFAAGLMSYSIDYGYKGIDRDLAFSNARSAFLGGVVVSAAALLVRSARGG